CRHFRPAEAPEKAVVERPARILPAGDLDALFCLNAITPFHQKDSPAAWDNLKKDLAKAKALGAYSVRIDMWWGVVEPEEGKFEWDFPDRVMNEIVAAGLEPFPILCYASAWSKDKSPDSPEEIRRFGKYVNAMVSRYKDRVRYWEVWNEPNIPPFWSPGPKVEDYSALLIESYKQAKAADPDCMVVGMCMAGADYDFLEEAYQHGVRDSFDILSWHHYNDQRDENVLAGEMRNLRRIMQRWGDGDKPIWITEIGLLTGPDPIGMKAYSERDQASWVVKKHLIAQAEHCERLYYFCMQDWSDAPRAEGKWGLTTHALKDKMSGLAYKKLVGLLRGAEFVGRLNNLPINVEGQLFSKGDGYFAIVWTRKDGAPTQVELYADANPSLISLVTDREEQLVPSQGEITFKVDQEPVAIRGVAARETLAAAAHFSPDPVYVSRGETAGVSLIVRNYLGHEAKVSLDGLKKEAQQAGLSLASQAPIYTVSSGGKFVIPLEITWPQETEQLKTHRLRTGKSLSLGVEPYDPFHIGFEVMQTGAQAYDIVTHLQNCSSKSLSGKMAWWLEGRPGVLEAKFSELAPNAIETFTRHIEAGRGEIVLAAEARADSGQSHKARLHLSGQPMIDWKPTVDGSLKEWNDVPSLSLRPPGQQTKPDRDETVSADDVSAEVKFAWGSDTLYVAAEVTDDTPLVNPHTGTNIWRGDALELYLGFNGPTREHVYGEKDFQIGLTPGKGGNAPVVWNWKVREGSNVEKRDGHAIARAKLAATKTDKGYLLEASIPLSEFGVSVKPGQLIGFDFAVDDKDDPKAEASEAALMWNGTGTNWRDPSRWGAAFIVK
ncbi:MAG: sugar-binding protein, partial [bacterium]